MNVMQRRKRSNNNRWKLAVVRLRRRSLDEVKNSILKLETATHYECGGLPAL